MPRMVRAYGGPEHGKLIEVPMHKLPRQAYVIKSRQQYSSDKTRYRQIVVAVALGYELSSDDLAEIDIAIESKLWRSFPLMLQSVLRRNSSQQPQDGD